MANKSDKPKTEVFVLKPGQEHNGFKGEGEDRVRHLYSGNDPKNNKVELTELQYKQFKDKFVTEASAKELQERNSELADLQKRQAEIEDALRAKGISVEDLLASKVDTTKKPDPAPSVGTSEPTPSGVTPAPTGSTSDPVNQPPKTESKK